ncbi:MAG: magnesium/cobalt transporter CorA [Bdellovibrionaceae bacterium]|nr:magnesium/cobalt transporter CorA [Pseudobdellovibrionaceae bacterium]
MRAKSAFKKARKKVELFKKTQKKALLPPGTPVHIGDIPDFKPYVTIHTYGPDSPYEELKVENNAIEPMLRAMPLETRTNWVDVEGIHDLSVVKTVSSVFDIHPLTQEDLVNTNLRPAFESFPGYYYFSLKMIYTQPDTGVLQQEHVSLILRGNTVLSFQEVPGDVFSVIRDRIAKGIGKVRTRGADYLAYMLLDAIVDGYYQITDHIGEKIEALEDELRLGAREGHLERIYDIKREVLFLRKNIFPVRDMVNKIQVEGSVFAENSRIYITDLYDHIQQVAESIAIYTELSTVLLDTYHAQMNLRMNQIFKVLTMFSTIFLPLNFIAGIYGMNFEYMPELHSRQAYPIVLGTMFLIAFGMLGWFVWKGWLFENRLGRNPRRTRLRGSETAGPAAHSHRNS